MLVNAPVANVVHKLTYKRTNPFVSLSAVAATVSVITAVIRTVTQSTRLLNKDLLCLLGYNLYYNS
jgi:hypothetical protein